jgi:UDP-N-acetylmuramoyl-tripeptide--D-alanyl-D-alanine ligase
MVTAPRDSSPAVAFDPAALCAWCRGDWLGRPPAALRGVWHDTRAPRSGGLYVAVKGARFDGHDFVEDAERMGAAAALVSREWAAARTRAATLPVLAVPDTAAALRALAHGHRRAWGGRVLAVTGSAGKTTVKELIADMLAEMTPTARTRGNWNNALGVAFSLLNTPGDAAWGVFEIGTSAPGEIADLCGMLEPNWGVVTNIGPAHLAFFGTEEAIAEEKGALLAALPADGLAVLNADGGHLDALRRRARCRVLTAGRAAGVDYRWRDQNASAHTVEMGDAGTGERVTLPLPGAGRHMAQNAGLAAAAARRAGVSWEKIASALRAFRGLPMRWERQEINGVRIVNDAYNANPLSMRAALDAFAAEPAGGGKWLVLGGMRELGDVARREHEALGRCIAEGAWTGLIAVGADAEPIARGARAAGMDADAVMCCATAADAAACLDACTAPGDAVLLKGSRGFRLENVLTEWRGKT